ncbi:unnamed protein product [Ectocarpus fasciculatus]
MGGVSFIVTLCLLLTANTDGLSSKKKRRKGRDSVYDRKRECETGTCGHLVPLEAKNCVHECVSPDCYRKTYAEPLEDGEINLQLSKNFMSCAQRDLKQSMVAKRRSDRQEASGSAKGKSAATALDPASDNSRQEDIVLHADGRAIQEPTSGENVASADSLEGER